MAIDDYLFQILGTIVVAAPFLLVLCIGFPTLLGRPLAERTVGQLVHLTTAAGLIASAGILVLMLSKGHRNIQIGFGSWVSIPHYHFAFKFVFDRLSVPFVILTFALCGVIGSFANSYMHREPGFNRFFALYSVFLFGMVVAALAGTIETLFSGWELVGLSSALLVAFYQTRRMPVSNGFHVWIVYRISDAAFLVAAVIMHRLTGEGDFAKLLGAQSWPEGHALVSGNQAFFLGLLLLVTAMGKSAMVPFSGWLPRAMEGPTPSSAIFYGALSVHLGVFLLLRFSPILDLSPAICAIIVGIGLLSAIYGAFVSRVQTDIKSALSFASLTQVGLIMAEIGLGFRYLALVHLIGHACLRTLQFLRAPSVLHDYQMLENAIHSRLPRITESWQRALPHALLSWLYRLAISRGYLDDCLKRLVVRPVLGLFEKCDGLDQRWYRLLAGVPPVSTVSKVPSAVLEDAS